MLESGITNMAPFKSKSQARFMFAKKPAIAKEFAAKTPSIKALPNKVKKLSATKAKGMSTKALGQKLMPKGQTYEPTI